MTKVYQQAFTEVYEILNYLDEENYNKIPKDVIIALEENKDNNYNFFIDESMPFYEQDILEETKAILFNLYRDYLANSEIRDKIIQYQKKEFNELEKIKRDEYPSEDIFIKESIKKNANKTVTDDKVSIMKYKDNIIDKFLKRIKKILGK